MEVDYDDDALRRAASDPDFDAGFSSDVVKAFRKRIQLIGAAKDERDFYAMKSLHFEKLRGTLEGKYSMRLNKQWRLILQLEKREDSKAVVVIAIDDYH